MALALLGGLTGCFGDLAAPAPDDLRGLTEAARRLAADPQARSELLEVLRERSAALRVLMEVNPRAAVAAALPADELARLGAIAGAGAWLEERIQVQDEIEVRIADGADGRSWTELHLVIEGQPTRLSLARPPADVQSGDLVAVDGVRSADRMVMAAESAHVLGLPIALAGGCTTTGAQNVAVIHVVPPGGTSPVTSAFLDGVFFDAVDTSLAGYWADASYGLASASGAVFGPYTLDREYGCNETSAMRDKAIELADADVFFPDYTRLFIVFPEPSTGCSFAGLANTACGTLASAGDGAFVATTSWLDGDYMTVHNVGVSLAAHEGGHNLGLAHASSYDYYAETLGAPGIAGVIGEYGDPFSTLGPGASGRLGHYTAPHKVALGWLDPADEVATVEGDGTFLVTPYAGATAGLKALKIRRAAGLDEWLWVELRQPIGAYESTLDSRGFVGALVHFENATTGTRSLLLDYTPGTSVTSDPIDGAFAFGQSWFDPHGGLTLAVAEAGSDMQVTASYGAATCAVHKPLVTQAPAVTAMSGGQSRTISVTVTSLDGSDCPAQTMLLSRSVPPGWTSTLNPSSVTLAPGASATATFTVTTPATLSPGHGVARVTARAGSPYSGYGTTIVAAGTAAPPFTVALAPTQDPIAVGQNTKLKATVKNGSTAIPGAVVTFSVVRPDGTNGVATVSTNGGGVAQWTYTADQLGPHWFIATAAKSGNTAVSNATTVTVQ